MLRRFGKDAGSLLGVEIARDSIRILQLRRLRRRLQVVAWALEPLSAQEQADPGAVTAALARAHRRSGTQQRRVALALTASQIICKRHSLPVDLPDIERETYLLAEAQSLFPIPLEDLALDFQVLGPTAGRSGFVDVLVGACRQSLLEPMVLRIEEAGLEVGAVEVDSLVLARTLPHGGRGPAALLSMDAGGMTLHRWPDRALAWQADPRTNEGGRALASGEMLDEPTCLWVTGESICEASAAAMAQRLGMRWALLEPLRGADLAGLKEADGLVAAAGAMTLAYGLALGGLQ